jgi:hypothetical protein
MLANLQDLQAEVQPGAVAAATAALLAAVHHYHQAVHFPAKTLLDVKAKVVQLQPAGLQSKNSSCRVVSCGCP